MVMGTPDINPIIKEANYQQKNKTKKKSRTLIRIFGGQAQRTMRAEYKGTWLLFRDPRGEWRFAMRRGREGRSQQGRRHKQRPRGRIVYGFPGTESRPPSEWRVVGGWRLHRRDPRPMDTIRQMVLPCGWEAVSSKAIEQCAQVL